jgi:hypothetical protein
MSVDLVCPGGIAEILKCTRAHVLKRIVRSPGFPKPAINLSRKMRQWDRDDVMTFLTSKPRCAGQPRRS